MCTKKVSPYNLYNCTIPAVPAEILAEIHQEIKIWRELCRSGPTALKLFLCVFLSSSLNALNCQRTGAAGTADSG